MSAEEQKTTKTTKIMIGVLSTIFIIGIVLSLLSLGVDSDSTEENTQQTTSQDNPF